VDAADAEVDDVEMLPRLADAAEDQLMGTNGAAVVGSALVLPGLADPSKPNRGKAPWLYGSKVFDLGTSRVVLTSAEALLRSWISREPELQDGLTLSVDLSDGACAVVLTPDGSRVVLNLMALDPPAATFDVRAFERTVWEQSAKPDTDLGALLDTGKTAAEALRIGDESGDVVCRRLTDDLTCQLGTFLGLLVRLIRPANLLLSAWLIRSRVCSIDAIANIIRRRAPSRVSERLVIRDASGDKRVHSVGGGLHVIECWLESASNGAYSDDKKNASHR
jgi:hypothetical protein